MKIIGGSFGIGGKAWVSRDNCVVIENGGKVVYPASRISEITAEAREEQRFGVIGFVIGSLLLSAVLAFFIGILGVVLAVFMAFFGSKYKESKQVVHLLFEDGKKVQLQCSPHGTKKLINLKR